MVDTFNDNYDVYDIKWKNTCIAQPHSPHMTIERCAENVSFAVG
jgi:hypothetical protein